MSYNISVRLSSLQIKLFSLRGFRRGLLRLGLGVAVRMERWVDSAPHGTMGCTGPKNADSTALFCCFAYHLEASFGPFLSPETGLEVPKMAPKWAPNGVKN